MYHFYRAAKVRFIKDTIVEITYQDGSVIEFDIREMYDRFPQFKELEEDQILFHSGHLDPGGFGIIWNDELDLSVSGLYQYGKFVRKDPSSLNNKVAFAICTARNLSETTQDELAKRTGLDQSDICKIERAQGNPTLKKIEKIFEALNVDIEIKVKPKKKTA